MGNPLTSSQFVRLLDTRLRQVAEAQFNELPSMIPTLFNVLDSDSAWEEFFEVGDVPDIPEFNGALEYLPIYPGYHRKIEHKEYAAGLQFQRKLLDDKKYNVLEGRAKKLAKSAFRTREKIGVKAFEDAFSAAFDFMTSEEGKALCSSSHLTKSQVSTSTGFDNSGTSALSKTSIATTRLSLKQFRTDIGERFQTSDNFALIVPAALEETAYEIVNTPKGLDSGEGNVNFHQGRYSVIVVPRLDDTDTNNWFMVDVDAMKEYLLFFDRIPAEFNNTVDFDTFQILHSTYFRCSYGWIDWRWVYGHNVS